MEFWKMHGIGNDFVVTDGSNTRGIDLSKFALAVCDRHFGIGADGLLVVEPSETADARMRMFNPDGSESEMCGNGIRCFAKFLYEKGYTKKTSLKIDTLAGILTTDLHVERGQVEWVRADMGRPKFKPQEIPVVLDITPVLSYPLEVGRRVVPITCVSMGNPHAVAFLNEPVGAFPLETFGPQVENHPIFPKRVNFEVVNVVGKNHLRARVWERGAGLTLACGSGACASAVAAKLLGKVGEGPVTVELPGGSLEIEWDGKGEVFLTGPAELVYKGEWPDHK